MNRERWRQIEELYHSALGLDPGQRAAFLRDRCGGDESLLLTVESLLEETGASDGLFAAPAFDLAARLMGRESAGDHTADDPLIGVTVAHFRILERLGAGGMGVVYKALDVKLHRHVALKLLPEMLSHNPGALERFRREACAASALNHPGICTIHEVSEHEGKPFIVMELLVGETLAQRIGGKALPLQQVLAFGADIADALAAAHARGIVHRDIKPANIFVTQDGRIKILDFGLAKLQPQKMSPGIGDFSTVDDLTASGLPMGTFAYMSPEQARGKELDARTDLFSFGAILYEMATGTMAFRGRTLAEIHDAILNRQPAPLTDADAQWPPRLQEITAKCLEKDQHLRYRSAAEIRADLLQLRRDMDSNAASTVLPPKPAAMVARARRAFKRRPVVLLVMAAALVAAVAAVAAYSYSYWLPGAARARPLTEKDMIVLADFSKHTGEPMFDHTLKEALAIDLRQSPFLNLLPDPRVGETLKMMQRSPGEAITPELGREICLRTSSKALLAGSIAGLGGHYALQLKATNCQTGETLAAVQAEAQDREKVLETLGEASGRLRSKLGESLASVDKYDKPLAEVTTSSLQALQAFSEGVRVGQQKGDAAAAPFFHRAVELDPNFAVAYLLLGFRYANLGETSLSIENMRRAYSLRDRLIEPERYFITSWYYAQVTGEVKKGIEQLQILIHEYPRHQFAHGALGNQYHILGQYENAAEEYREQLRLLPEHTFGYNLATAYMALNRLDEAQALLNQGLFRFPDQPFFRYNLYMLAFLRSDAAAMQEQLNWARGKPGIESVFLNLDSSTQTYYGRLGKGREVMRAAVAAAMGDDAKETAATYQTVIAAVEAEVGHQDRARQAARAAVALSPGREVRIQAAAALARAGDLAGAQKQLDDLNKEFPLDTMMQNYWVPAIQAQIELHKGHAGRALALLQSAQPYELAFVDLLPRMYAVYIRGQAHLAAGNAARAAGDFQKIVDHPTLVENGVTGPLARLYLGRARALEARSLQGPAGENAKAQARAAYQDFFTVWKDADPDIPILKQAKAEYARLE